MVGHHPPQGNEMIYLWGREYTKVIREYKHVIVLQLFGHTHSDHFQLVNKFQPISLQNTTTKHVEAYNFLL